MSSPVTYHGVTPAVLEALRQLLLAQGIVAPAGDSGTITGSTPLGHVTAELQWTAPDALLVNVAKAPLFMTGAVYGHIKSIIEAAQAQVQTSDIRPQTTDQASPIATPTPAAVPDSAVSPQPAAPTTIAPTPTPVHSAPAPAPPLSSSPAAFSVPQGEDPQFVRGVQTERSRIGNLFAGFLAQRTDGSEQVLLFQLGRFLGLM